MLNRLREGLRSLRQMIHAQWRRLTGDSVMRRRTISVAGAILLLLVASGLVFAAMAPASAPKQQAVARAQPTATQTATATPTATPTATATAKPKPKPIPKTPPPPPMPAAPTAPPPPPPNSGGSIVIGDSLFSQFCSTPTPTPPTPTATATNTPTATATSAATATATTPSGTATSTATGTTATGYTGGHTGLAMPAACVTCPYTAGNNPSQSQIASALASAAATYGLPVNLLKAVAWQESKWHEDVFSCDGGIGLMQIQYYTYPWLNQQVVPECNLSATSYDPYTLQGNANLGAKYLKWLSCLYSYWGNQSGTSLNNPGVDSSAYNYLQAGLQYPDTNNANGTPNPNSLCAAVFNQDSYYPAMPSTTSMPWSCPFNATAGDNTLLDLTLSAYNEGASNLYYYGIMNPNYISAVEGYVPQFANGSLPVPS